MAYNPDLYRLERLVNTPGADKMEIAALRHKLWTISIEAPGRKRQYNVTPVRFTFPNGEVKTYGSQTDAVEASGSHKATLERASRLGLPLKKGKYAGAMVEILSL